MTMPLLCLLLGTLPETGLSDGVPRCFSPASVTSRIAAQPRQASALTRPAQGRLLVARRSVGDPRFAETVILLIAYGDEGAMGIIINRPTQVRLASALPKMKELRDRPERVFVGGPVSPNAMLLLIRAGKKPDGAQPVFENVYVSGSLDTLRKALGQRGKTNRLRAYAGYAGWGPGQLDHEIERGDWLIGAADAAIVFEMPSADMWPKLIERLAVEWTQVEAGEQVALGTGDRFARDGFQRSASLTYPRELQIPSSASTSASGGGPGWKPDGALAALLPAPPP